MSGVFDALFAAGFTNFKAFIPSPGECTYELDVMENRPGEWEAIIRWRITREQFECVGYGQGATAAEAMWDLDEDADEPGARPWLGDVDAIPGRIIRMTARIWRDACKKTLDEAVEETRVATAAFAEAVAALSEAAARPVPALQLVAAR